MQSIFCDTRQLGKIQICVHKYYLHMVTPTYYIATEALWPAKLHIFTTWPVQKKLVLEFWQD